MFRKLALLGAMALALLTPASAADVSTGYSQGPGGYYLPSDRSGPYSISSAGVATLLAGTASGLQAGENHLGEIGNNQTTITSAQTVTASSAYAAGDAIGGLITFSNAARVSSGSGLIQSVVINSKSVQTTQMDLFLFNSNPSGSTCTNKTTISIAAADFDKVLGVAHIVDWSSAFVVSVGQAQNLAMPFALTSGTTIYGCLITRSTPTFTATSDISVALRAIRN